MTDIVQLLADEAEYLLNHHCAGIPRESLHLQGTDYIDCVVSTKDRNALYCAACKHCMDTAGLQARAIFRLKDGIVLLNAIQDVYRDNAATLALT